MLGVFDMKREKHWQIEISEEFTLCTAVIGTCDLWDSVAVTWEQFEFGIYTFQIIATIPSGQWDNETWNE